MLEKEILKLPEFQKKINQNNKKEVKKYRFKNEDQLYLYIENLPTIQKIFVVQNLLKEMMSIKDRFQENKEKMKEKIDSNSFKYFKDFILIKEKYDYIESNNPEFPLNYILLKNTNEILCSFEEEKNKVFIENFFFELRNNNNLVLKIIEKINGKYYEQLSNFLVHFLYENTTSSSFAQDELMAITYLIFEKIICQKLPSVITQKNLNKDSEIYNNKKQLFLYHYLKAFTRKPEIRNYLSSIIHDSILELENIKKILNLNIRTIHKSMEDEEIENEKLFSGIMKKNSTTNEGIEKLLKGEKFIHQITMRTPSVSEEIINKNKIRHSVGAINSNSNSNTNKNMNNNNFINILDPFFKENDFTQLSLSKMLYHLNNKKRNEIENAYMEYLISLKEEIHQHSSGVEIFSSSMISDAFKGTKINQDKITLEDMANNYKDNFNKIIYFIEEILHNINSNIVLLPYSIKCMYYILNKLLGKKYKEKEGHITLFQKFIIKLKFIFNGFIIPTLANPLYNGIISDNVLSKSTKENANLISKIFEKMISGNLFNIINITSSEEPSLIIFNKYITEKIPFLFEIITNIDNHIENNFECPLFITNLLSTYNKINDLKRNINYDYFLYNKDDNIKYQCICFSSSDLMMIVNVIDSLDSAIINKSNSDLLKKYRKIFEQRYEDNKDKKKEEYVLISKFSYRESFLNEIKSVTEGHLENYFKTQKTINKGSNNDEMLRVKKCLIEILIYINKLHKENFNPFIKRKDELFLFHNSNVNKYYKYNKLFLYNDTVFEGDKKFTVNSLTGSFHVSRKISKGLAEDNLEDADFLRDIFPVLLSMIKYEIGYNFSNQKLEHIIFCVSYLQIHIKTLPINYVRNNYSKLFIDIMKDVECLIKSLQNNILNQFYLKIKEGNKLNLITSKYLYKIKNMEKYFCIEYLFNKLNLQDPFDLVVTERTQTISTKDISSLIASEACSIPIFIKKFPDFRKNEREIDDIIEQENSKKIPDTLKNYFKDIKNLIKNEQILSKYTAEEYLSICYELENYILFRLYEKLFPTLESSKDKFIYKKCCRLSFIKPENYLKDKIKIDENLLKTVIDYINDMDKKYTPVDKIHMFGKAFRILQSFMAFSSGKSDFGIDDTLPLLIYAILKAKPKMINTNFNYCKNYINPELDKKQYGILLMQIGMVIKIICEMKHTDLIGVTEQQFGKDKEEPHEIKRSKNLQRIYEVNDY